jgi:hypothetical protein
MGYNKKNGSFKQWLADRKGSAALLNNDAEDSQKPSAPKEKKPRAKKAKK